MCILKEFGFNQFSICRVAQQRSVALRANLPAVIWRSPITRLQAENNLLTNKVLRLDSKSTHPDIENNYNTETQRLQRQVHVLLKAYKGVRISSRGVVDERYEDKLNSNLLGLYGIYGLILTPCELKEIESAQRELPEDLKANLTKSLSLLR